MSAPMRLPETTPTLLADVASAHPPLARGALDRVGMTEIELPLHLRDAAGRRCTVPGRADAFVSLDAPDVKGIHMSRLFLLLSETLGKEELTVPTLQTVLHGFVASHSDMSRSAHLDLRFDYMVERPALRSGHYGWRTYPVRVAADLRDGHFQATVSTRITYSSTCPCSAALARHRVRDAFLERFAGRELVSLDEAATWLDSERGVPATPHAQRSHADVTVALHRSADRLELVALIDRVEKALGTPVQAAVKREDEQAFAELNGENLMFCEDAARRLQASLAGDDAYVGFEVRIEHQESLHPHNAVASASQPW